MDWKVSWTPEAVADLGGIVRHIVREDRDAARRMGEDLLACAASLRSFPRRGRRYASALDRGEVRELPCRGYRIFYKVSESRSLVEVLNLDSAVARSDLAQSAGLQRLARLTRCTRWVRLRKRAKRFAPSAYVISSTFNCGI